MIKVLNLENVEFSSKHGIYKGNETYKEGIIYNDEMWILKYFSDIEEFDEEGNKLERSQTALSEFIASHIFDILGYQVQETMLAKRYDSLVVICKDFAIEKDLIGVDKLHNAAPWEVLKLEYNTIKPVKVIYDDQIQSYIFHFKHNPKFSNIEGITERFWEQAIIDVFINNGDRGTTNWGVLKDANGVMTLAPMFDNGNSLHTPLTEDEIEELLVNDKLLYNSVLSTSSTYLAIRYTEYFIGNEDLRKAVLRTVPLIESKLKTIFTFIDSIPEYWTFEDGTKLMVCSANRKKLYKKHLMIRLEVLLKPLYEAAMNYRSDKE